MSRLAFALALAAAAVVPATQAATWSLSFTDTTILNTPDAAINPAPTVFLQITTEDVLSVSPNIRGLGLGYRITSFTGTRSGTEITPMFSSTNALFGYGIDPYLYPDAQQLLSFAGLGYRIGETEFHLYGSSFAFGNNPPTVQWWEGSTLPSTDPWTPYTNFYGTMTLAPVPEVGSLFLLLAGLPALAWATRRRS